MRANLDTEKLKAQIISSSEMLLHDNTVSVVLNCVMQALENRKQYLRRADDDAARAFIDSKIEKIRGIL